MEKEEVKKFEKAAKKIGRLALHLRILLWIDNWLFGKERAKRKEAKKEIIRKHEERLLVQYTDMTPTQSVLQYCIFQTSQNPYSHFGVGRLYGAMEGILISIGKIPIDGDTDFFKDKDYRTEVIRLTTEYLEETGVFKPQSKPEANESSI